MAVVEDKGTRRLSDANLFLVGDSRAGCEKRSLERGRVGGTVSGAFSLSLSEGTLVSAAKGARSYNSIHQQLRVIITISNQ